MTTFDDLLSQARKWGAAYRKRISKKYPEDKDDPLLPGTEIGRWAVLEHWYIVGGAQRVKVKCLDCQREKVVPWHKAKSGKVNKCRCLGPDLDEERICRYFKDHGWDPEDE